MATDNAAFSHTGNRIPWAATASSKEVVVVKSGAHGTGMIGVAIGDCSASAPGELEVDGCWTLTKNAGEAFTAGQKLYWQDTNNELTGEASGATYAGRCAEAAASAATTAKVLLNHL